jgi:hypothetical protein
MTNWELQRKRRIFKAKFFNRNAVNKYFLIGMVSAIMNWFLAIPILGLISMCFFLLGVIGLLT